MAMTRIPAYCLSALTLAVLSGLSVAHAESVISHQDHRVTPKLLFHPADAGAVYKSPQAAAEHWVQRNAKRLGLDGQHSQLVLRQQRESLTATHYYFQQYHKGIALHQAEVIVSVSKKEGRVSRVFNNAQPDASFVSTSSKATLSTNQALERSWQKLQAASLHAKPRADLVFLPVGNRLLLSYRTVLATAKPTGTFETFIDASTGHVLKIKQIDTPNKTSRLAGKWISAGTKQSPAFAQALRAFEQRSAQNKTAVNGFKADASAQVFDPDPRTTLNDGSLVDTSTAGSFNAAYLTRTLRDVTFAGGTYSLTGPWVTIADISAPTTAPSTTTDGQWNFARGNNAFNDAMTYFHIDQSQRYMQSLGFTGSKAIQDGSIQVDSDGVDGGDNSFFSPADNHLEFGHGGVDDNEDADVILHEYGHAIQWDINNNWDGGDTGAMGEGFGDYWAGSYSYSTPNGQIFNPAWVFTWDGHNSFWPGRQMDRTDFQYDPNATYGAHDEVGGVLGDELWSTPLFQSLVSLMAAGVPRSQVDQIVLESHFGLGTGMRMPEMAQATVDAAAALFPSGDHANVFLSKFVEVNILQDGLALGEVSFTETEGDGVADPGETLSLTLPLKNNNNVTATAINGSLSTTTAGVTVPVNASSYANLAPAATGNNSTAYTVAIPEAHVCGTPIALHLQANYSTGSNRSDGFDFEIPVGERELSSVTSSTPVAIPDDNPTGATATLVVSGTGRTVSSGFKLGVNISHTYRGDLQLDLTSPAGTTVRVLESSNDGSEDYIGDFPGDFEPANSLDAFVGEPLDGTWSLKVVDTVGEDVGTLNAWSLRNYGPWDCGETASNTAPVAAVANGTITTTAGNSVSLNGSSSTDADGDTLSFAWTQTSGTIVTLNNANTATATFTAPNVSSAATLQFLLTVSDGNGGTDTETVSVTVNPSAGNGGGGGGSGSFTWFGAAFLAWAATRRRHKR